MERIDYDPERLTVVNDRITLTSNFDMTYTKKTNIYGGILGAAQKKMPNMAIYRENVDGVPTNDYYYAIQAGQGDFGFQGSGPFDGVAVDHDHVEAVVPGILRRLRVFVRDPVHLLLGHYPGIRRTCLLMVTATKQKAQ